MHKLCNYCSLLWVIILFSHNTFAESSLKFSPAGTLAYPECTHAIPEGASVFQQADGTIKVVSSQGVSRILPVCPYAETQKEHFLPPWVNRRADNGWLMYGFIQGKNFQFMRSQWNVPNVPTRFDNQLLYLFNGFETFYEIVQPVLQFGVSPAGGGAYWSMASWWATNNGQALHSRLIRVNPGDQIVGMLISTSPGVWSITIMDLNTNQQSTLDVHNVNPLIYSVIALEGYNVMACQDYPGSQLSFSQSQIADAGVFLNRINWASGIQVHNCNQAINCSGQNCTFSWNS